MDRGRRRKDGFEQPWILQNVEGRRLFELHAMKRAERESRRYDLSWSHRHTEEIARIFSTLSRPRQLKWANLAEVGPHAVGPKVDGVRHVVLSERNTGAVYLLPPSGAPTRIGTSRTRGFWLDAEVVTVGSSRVVIALDVIRTDRRQG